MEKREIKIWANEGNDFMVEYKGFWAIVPIRYSRVIDLGLDAIQPNCICMEWENFAPSYIELLGERGIAIIGWASDIHNEWKTLG